MPQGRRQKEREKGRTSKDRLQGEGIAGSIVRVVALFQVLPYPHEHRRLSSVAAGMRVRLHAAAPITQACAQTKYQVSVWQLRQAPMTEWRGAGKGRRRACAPRASNGTRASYATRAGAVGLQTRRAFLDARNKPGSQQSAARRKADRRAPTTGRLNRTAHTAKRQARHRVTGQTKRTNPLHFNASQGVPPSRAHEQQQLPLPRPRTQQHTASWQVGASRQGRALLHA